MRLSIRWKLILSIVLPLLVIATVVMWATFSRMNRFSIERMQYLVTEQAQHFATRLDDRFSKIVLIAKSSAHALSLLPVNDEQYIQQILNASLESDSLVFGSSVLLEADEPGGSEEVVVKRLYRDTSGGISTLNASIESIEVGANATWLQNLIDSPPSNWHEPYLDEYAQGSLVISYSEPLQRRGVYAGVITVDVILQDIADRIDIGNDNDYPFVIVDAMGRFISHPNPEMIWNGDVSSRSEELNNPELMKLANELISGQSGVVKVSEPALFQSDAVFWIFYAPIQSTGWSLAVVVPEVDILSFRDSQFQRGVIGLVIMIGLVIVSVLIIGTSLTRPLTTLSEGVQELAQGDLNVEIRNVNSSDEIGELARGFNSMVAQLRRHVYALTRETAARESYESEMQFANQVQASLLPDITQAFTDNGEFELFAINRPARHVAGDFFDFFMLDNHQMILVIADVSGKGMASALLMAVTRTIVRNQARSGKSPAAILSEANRLLIETNMKSLFVTMFIARYDISTGDVVYANAGHPRPFKLCCDDNVSKFGDTTGTIVGMLEDIEFTENSEHLNPGDYLVLYTDGVPDARSPDGEFFGEENFIDLLKICSGKTAREICEYTVDVLVGYQANKLKDDTTLLVLKRSLES